MTETTNDLTRNAGETANKVLMIGLYVSSHYPTRTDEETGIHRMHYLKLVSEEIERTLRSALTETARPCVHEGMRPASEWVRLWNKIDYDPLQFIKEVQTNALASAAPQGVPEVSKTSLYGRNLYAAQKLLMKELIRYSEFDEVLRVLDDAHMIRAPSAPVAWDNDWTLPPEVIAARFVVEKNGEQDVIYWPDDVGDTKTPRAAVLAAIERIGK